MAMLESVRLVFVVGGERTRCRPGELEVKGRDKKEAHGAPE